MLVELCDCGDAVRLPLSDYWVKRYHDVLGERINSLMVYASARK
jgi:hypothetical protein